MKEHAFRTALGFIIFLIVIAIPAFVVWVITLIPSPYQDYAVFVPVVLFISWCFGSMIRTME